MFKEKLDEIKPTRPWFTDMMVFWKSLGSIIVDQKEASYWILSIDIQSNLPAMCSQRATDALQRPNWMEPIVIPIEIVILETPEERPPPSSEQRPPPAAPIELFIPDNGHLAPPPPNLE